MRTFGRTALAGLALAGAAVFLAGCATYATRPVGNTSVPEPAKSVDLNRYLGLWYELYRYEAPFEKDCEAVTAEYSLKDDGSIKVVNSCHQGSVNGKLKTSVGKAKVVDTVTNAKLKVSFFGPFYGDYWVLDHADDYSWSIVGEPSGKYLWVLSRLPNPAMATRNMLERRVRELGYNWSMVRPTQQKTPA